MVDCMVTTSISLLDRVRRPGDTEAWNRFVELYTPLIHHAVQRVGIADSDVPDVVQEVFVLLLRKLPSFEYEQRKSFRAWLTVIARNKCVDYVRGKRPMPVGSNDGAGRLVSDVEFLTEAEYRAYVTRRALELMQTEFEDNSWRACWELVVAGRPAADVAGELGMTVNAVYIAKSRVLRRLRDELRDLVE
jgi:RNA polymerase sigma-70 factor (ECF subfamily)